jgi:DNA-binding HxlR family transcriptional regulator
MKSHLRTTKKNIVCPTRELLDRVGDKWSMLLIITLAQAPQRKSRFSQLLKNLDGISQRMLTSTLRHLERDGFIKRYFYPEIPPRVEYELTSLGNDVLSILQKLKSWVENNWPKIHTARVNYDLEHPE